MTARRYSPNVVMSLEKRVMTGNPDPELISTSCVERNNLSMRMGMRRFTRLNMPRWSACIHALQLLPSALNARQEGHSRDGGRRRRSRLDHPDEIAALVY